MLRNTLISAAAIGLLAAPAMADSPKANAKPAGETVRAGTAVKTAPPALMTDDQMDAIVGGAILVQTRFGNTVWTVEGLSPPQGTNNGGRDATANASGGLLKAVGAGGLVLN